jgi:hypothetical protein
MTLNYQTAVRDPWLESQIYARTTGKHDARDVYIDGALERVHGHMIAASHSKE